MLSLLLFQKRRALLRTCDEEFGYKIVKDKRAVRLSYHLSWGKTDINTAVTTIIKTIFHHSSHTYQNKVVNLHLYSRPKKQHQATLQQSLVQHLTIQQPIITSKYELERRL